MDVSHLHWVGRLDRSLLDRCPGHCSGIAASAPILRFRNLHSSPWRCRGASRFLGGRMVFRPPGAARNCDEPRFLPGISFVRSDRFRARRGCWIYDLEALPAVWRLTILLTSESAELIS